MEKQKTKSKIGTCHNKISATMWEVQTAVEVFRKDTALSEPETGSFLEEIRSKLRLER